MIKKEITYEDLDGNPVTGVFYFHLSKMEIAEFEVKHGGDLSGMIRQIAGTSRAAEVLPIFKELIAASVGVRGDDNRRFIKTDEIRDAFMESEAYSELFLEFIRNPMTAAEFMAGIVPASVGQQVGADMRAEMAKLVTPSDNLTIKEVSLDTYGNPHTYAEVVSDEAVLEAAIKDAEKRPSLKGVSFQGEIVDETTEKPARGINEFSRQELLEMDADTFHTLAGPARGWSKALTAIAMQRRAGDLD